VSSGQFRLKSTTSRRMFTALLIGLGAYALLCALIGLGQRRFIYFPTKAPEPALLESAAQARLEPLRNRTGERIGWMRRSSAAPARLRVLIAHGNAGCAVHRGHYADAFASARAEVFILEYPGYGDRPGKPNEASFHQAAEEAFALLAEQGPLHLLGESLGTGVATGLAARHPDQVAGLLLVAPYNNFTDLAQRHMPLLPVRWILRDRFPSDVFLRSYRGPVAVLLAGRDEVVPNELGRSLFDGYQGPKRLWVDEQATHNSVCDQPPEFWSEVVEFWGAPNPAAPQPSRPSR
jgi:uncharacterized protein